MSPSSLKRPCHFACGLSFIAAFILSACSGLSEKPATQGGPGRSNSNPWKVLAYNDLKAMHDLISKHHPGPLDENNSDFREWLKKGYQLALAKAETVDSYGGYYFTQKFFANGFKDGHLHFYVGLTPQKVGWPGFTVAKRGKDYVVHSPSSRKEGPKKGWKVLLCDHESPADLMTTNVFPYQGNEDLESHWVRYAPELFVDRENPFISRPETCVFDTGKEKKELTLSWDSIRIEEIEEPLEKAAYGPRPEQAYSTRDGLVWMTVPTFGPQGDQAVQLKNMIKELPKARKAKIVVFDVRGNTGGNSEWGADIVRSLYGEEFTNPTLDAESQKKTFVEWRVSDDNIKHLESVLPYIKENFGADSRIYKIFDRLAKKMKTAPRDQLYRQPDFEDDSSKSTQGGDAKSPVKAKVFLLTDGKCASACLDFADNLLAMPGVTHIGAPTSADTVYMDVRSEKLPSTIARLSFALKVYRNRKRANNEPYVPDHVWNGDLWHTKKVRAWIKSLAH